MVPAMENLSPARAIIKRWPSRKALAADAGASHVAVHRWWKRDAIPSKHHTALMLAAPRRGIALTVRELHEASGMQGAAPGPRVAEPD